ncbi:uncharacterized protein [Temnothorax longispinosus]
MESSRESFGKIHLEWWKNLDLSDSDHAASTSPRHNHSAAIVKTNILQTSTSESEKELELRKRKVHLRAANNRKSTNNAFSSALNDTEVTVPLKLRKKRANYSELHSDSDRGISRERLQEDEEDDNLSPSEKILKSKPRISRRRKNDSTKDQNPFQDILTEDGALNGNTTRQSVALEKESSKRSMHRSIDASKEHADDKRKSVRASQAIPLKSVETDSLNLLPPNVENAALQSNEIVQSSDESSEIVHNKLLNVRLLQRARKSVGRNAFADALADDANVENVSLQSNANKIVQSSDESSEIVHNKPLNVRLLQRARKSVGRNAFADALADDANVENVSLQSNANKIVQSSDESSESVHNKPLNVRLLQRARKSVGRNAFADALADDVNVENAALQSNANEIVKSSDESFEIVHNTPLKFRLLQRARKSVGRNAFADALANSSTANPNKENDIHDNEPPLVPPPTLSPSKRSVNRSKTKIDITHENSPTRKRSRSSLIAEEKQSLDARAKDNIEANSSSSSLDDDESRRKKSVFLKSKSGNSRKSLNKNPYEEILEEDSNISARKSNVSTKDNRVPVQANDNTGGNLSNSSLDNNESRGKRSVFLKPKSRISASFRKSLSKNPYEKILEEDNNISPRKSNASTEDNRASLERDETATRIIQMRGSLSTEKLSQSERNRTSVEGSDISLTSSNSQMSSNSEKPSNVERDVSKKLNVSLENKSRISENSDLANASKSISRKSIVAKTPEKEVSFSRKSTREETSKKHTNAIGSTSTNNIVTPEISDNSRDDTDIEQDLSTFKRVSKSGPDKEGRLTRDTLRNRSETPKSANTGVHKVLDNSQNDASSKRASSVPKRLSKSSPGIETRLPRLKNRSETPKPANTVHEAIDNSHNNTNIEHDSSSPKRLSKSSPAKEDCLTRNNFRNRSETPKSISKNMELPRRSINWIADNEEYNVNADSEINIGGISQIMSSTRFSKVNANIGTHRSTIQSVEIEAADGENTDLGIQITQRHSTSTEAETGNKAVNRQSVQSTNRTSIKESRETAGRQTSLNKSQNYRNTSVRASGKDVSFNASKLNSSKIPRKIDDFFKVKQASTTIDKSNERAQKSQTFDTEKMEKIKTELEKIKKREMAAMKKVTTDKKESALKTKDVKSLTSKQATKKKPVANVTKVVNKAFLVDGKVYRAPRLPRPKHWATDRLYKFLWNRMEPKYKLATRLKSEKFVQELAKIVSLVERRKNYENYEIEMQALMKQMARLGIISTRNDFYHFCQDFLPYEFRVKVVPMLLPGNKNNIPYDPEKLHIPLLDT